MSVRIAVVIALTLTATPALAKPVTVAVAPGVDYVYDDLDWRLDGQQATGTLTLVGTGGEHGYPDVTETTRVHVVVVPRGSGKANDRLKAILEARFGPLRTWNPDDRLPVARRFSNAVEGSWTGGAAAVRAVAGGKEAVVVVSDKFGFGPAEEDLKAIRGLRIHR